MGDVSPVFLQPIAPYRPVAHHAGQQVGGAGAAAARLLVALARFVYSDFSPVRYLLPPGCEFSVSGCFAGVWWCVRRLGYEGFPRLNFIGNIIAISLFIPPLGGL